jgi:hypothetical protein
MEDITKFAFLKAIWHLKDYVSDIVIGGGWAPLIYYHYLLGDKTKNPVRTYDIDLMVKPNVPLKGEKTIDQLLTNAGLSAEYKSLDTPPIIHYEGKIENCEVEIEFLTDQKGSTTDIVIEVQKGLYAEALRYISIATDNTIRVIIDDFQYQKNSGPFQVTVPTPQAYVFHKGLVFDKRKDELKKAKDLYYIFEVILNCNAIKDEIISGLSELKSNYPAWSKKFLKQLSKYFADSSSDGVLMVLSQRPVGLLPALNEDQYKQFVHGTFADLIDRIGHS